MNIMSKAKEKDTVKVHYTGKLTNGEVFDSSLDRAPLEFTIGAGQLIEGFDKGVVGMEVKQTKTIEISAENAYGPVNEQLIQKLNKAQLPESIHPQVGQSLVATHKTGEKVELLIREIQEDHIVVDANHPLAGKDLIFEVELVEIL